MDDRTTAIAEQIADLFEELRQRVIVLRGELHDSEQAAEGLRQALLALGVDVGGSTSPLSGDRLRDEIFSVLKETDPDQQGVHYQEIAERIEARGYVIRGRNRAGNALAHMSHAPQFRSLGKGQWTWADADGHTGSRTTDEDPGEVADGPPSAEGTLEVGRVYQRRELHAAGWGGDVQKGISYPAEGDHVLLFSDPGVANEFGYNDGWEEPGLYRYFGEWRGSGDMVMAGGNAAIHDRSPNLHLFVRADGGYRYQGAFAYEDDYTEPAERGGVTLQAIVFRLRAAGVGSG